MLDRYTISDNIMLSLDSDAYMKCARCGKSAMVTDGSTGERFCGVCGFVVNERIEDSGPERRSFSKDEHEDRSRTGGPSSLAIHDMGLATMIGHDNKDATGKPLSTSMKSTITRLRTWDSRSQVHESQERNFRQAFSELSRMKDKLALSDSVVEKTAYIYRKALEKNLARGRSIPGLIAAAMYLACRDTGTPRTLNEVARQINIKRKDVSRCYRLLLKELDLKMPVLDPIKCMSRIASQAGLNEKVKRQALTILEGANRMEITAGKDPMGLAAAALYLSCVINKEDTTQKVIALAAGVTEVTIRNRCKGLRELLDIKMPDKLNSKLGRPEKFMSSTIQMIAPTKSNEI
ncbi:Transcription initiation factor B [Candidatus Nitrosotalea sp. TS]|nr:Transcription initiation factor B [Candidatus Nitrosotalea sp. TS]